MGPFWSAWLAAQCAPSVVHGGVGAPVRRRPSVAALGASRAIDVKMYSLHVDRQAAYSPAARRRPLPSRGLRLGVRLEAGAMPPRQRPAHEGRVAPPVAGVAPQFEGCTRTSAAGSRGAPAASGARGQASRPAGSEAHSRPPPTPRARAQARVQAPTPCIPPRLLVSAMHVNENVCVRTRCDLNRLSARIRVSGAQTACSSAPTIRSERRGPSGAPLAGRGPRSTRAGPRWNPWAPADGEGRNRQIRPNPGLGRTDRVLLGPRRAQRAPGPQWRASDRSRAQEHAGGAPVEPLGSG